MHLRRSGADGQTDGRHVQSSVGAGCGPVGVRCSVTLSPSRFENLHDGKCRKPHGDPAEISCSGGRRGRQVSPSTYCPFVGQTREAARTCRRDPRGRDAQARQTLAVHSRSRGPPGSTARVTRGGFNINRFSKSTAQSYKFLNINSYHT